MDTLLSCLGVSSGLLITILVSELGFEIDRAYHPDGRVATAPVVDNLNPASHRLLGFVTGSPFLPIIKFGLHCRPERLGHRIVKCKHQYGRPIVKALVLDRPATAVRL